MMAFIRAMHSECRASERLWEAPAAAKMTVPSEFLAIHPHPPDLLSASKAPSRFIFTKSSGGGTQHWSSSLYFFWLVKFMAFS
jgi:hypothetical protein